MKLKFIRWGGLIGALLTGSVMIMSGDVVQGTGVIAAALGSASVVAKD